jgi:hypothetical protein
MRGGGGGNRMTRLRRAGLLCAVIGPRFRADGLSFSFRSDNRAKLLPSQPVPAYFAAGISVDIADPEIRCSPRDRIDPGQINNYSESVCFSGHFPSHSASFRTSDVARVRSYAGAVTTPH